MINVNTFNAFISTNIHLQYLEEMEIICEHEGNIEEAVRFKEEFHRKMYQLDILRDEIQKQTNCN